MRKWSQRLFHRIFFEFWTLIACCILLYSAPAHATLLQYVNWSVDPGTNVSFPEGSGLAGQFDLNLDYDNDYSADETVHGFCIETGENTSTGWEEYDFQPITSTHQEAAWLFAQGSDPVITQLAIWETIYENVETNGYDIENGIFTATINDSYLLDLNDVNSLLGTLPTSFDLGAFSGYSVAFSDGNQDLITNTSAPVPEPGTMFLLGSGLLGMIGIGRRRFVKSR